jgi:hypothetical protein
VFHSWEARIENHTKLAKLFVSTEDYCACNGVIASELIGGVDHVATFYKIINASGANQTVSENALDRLKDIEIRSTVTCETGFSPKLLSDFKLTHNFCHH